MVVLRLALELIKCKFFFCRRKLDKLPIDIIIGKRNNSYIHTVNHECSQLLRPGILEYCIEEQSFQLLGSTQ